MANSTVTGPEVPAHEKLLRGIVVERWWNPDDKRLSSAVFGFPKFSAYIGSMADEDELLNRFPDGSGIVAFNSGVARTLGFDSRHEPEQDDEAHANVYCNQSSKTRKKQARKLVEAANVTREPTFDKP